MGRLCERPGCSENAALAYGMRTEDLVFWLDVLRDEPSAESGVLCQRHGDSMIVPRGWTLDDLRDPDLHLFRPPPRPAGPATRRNRSRRSTNDETGQLELGGLVDLDQDTTVDDTDSTGVERATEDPPERLPDDPATTAAGTGDAATTEATRSGAVDWKPAFDDGDDLDGLLAARSPLLSRAFRGERG